MQRVKFKVAGDAATELELIRGVGSRVGFVAAEHGAGGPDPHEHDGDPETQ